MSCILVPTDGSDIANQAIPWGKELARDGDREIELLRSYHPLAAAYSYPDFATPPPVPYDLSGFARHAQKHLEVLVQEQGIEKAKLTVQEGEAAETIVAKSENDDVDLVVMCSHGRSGLGRWLLGSVTNQVVRAAHKPVLVVKASNEPVAPTFKRLLVPLDGSGLSEEGLLFAAKLARVFESEIVLLRCVDFTAYSSAHIQVALHYELEEAERYLGSLRSAYPDLTISSEVKANSATRGILEAARACDVIVMSTHGTSGFERWLLGSVTEKVLARSDKPVFVVCHGEA